MTNEGLDRQGSSNREPPMSVGRGIGSLASGWGSHEARGKFHTRDSSPVAGMQSPHEPQA